MTYGFLKIIILGFFIAAPVGPIGMLCIQRSLYKGYRAGLVTGLGAASADAIFAIIAAFGFNIMIKLLIGNQAIIGIIGGIFLCYLGIKIIVSSSHTESINTQNNSLLSNYLSSFFLTLTNPMTIMSFIAMFAGVSGPYIITHARFLSNMPLVVGIFIGSMLWWLILSCVASSLQKMISKNALFVINKLSGSIIVLFGVYVVLKTCFPIFFCNI